MFLRNTEIMINQYYYTSMKRIDERLQVGFKSHKTKEEHYDTA